MRKVDDPRIGTLLALAKALNVPTSLLIGEMVPVVGSIGADGLVTMFPNGPEADLQLVPRPPARQSNVVAYRVEGEGLRPAYRNGDLIYAAQCDKQIGEGCCFGAECIAQVNGGPAYLRVLGRGSEPGKVSLRWFSSADIEADALTWVAPVLFVMRAQTAADLAETVAESIKVSF
jgi:hypothetical protein